MTEVMQIVEKDFKFTILNPIKIIKENLDMRRREMEEIQMRPTWNF